MTREEFIAQRAEWWQTLTDEEKQEYKAQADKRYCNSLCNCERDENGNKVCNCEMCDCKKVKGLWYNQENQ